MPNSLRYIFIAVISALLFFPLLGQVHLFDWDEINFAECAREMLVTGDYLGVKINYLPFWEKPPLFIWMQAVSMNLFGVNEYAARFPNAFMGVVTLLCLYYVGKRIVNEKMATWWTLLYAATLLPHFYFKSGIIDPTFNLFIFLAFFQVHLMRFGIRPLLHAVLAGVFLGLAVMTKGPVAILVAALSFGVYIIFNRGFAGYKIGHLVLIALSALAVTCIWFGIDIIQTGGWFVREFITYQIRLFQTEDADHGGPFLYHFIVLLLGCFPASAFLFQCSRKRLSSDSTPTRDFTRWMWIMFWVVLLLFSIVKTKIVHYSSLCYFPLTYLAALQLYRLADSQYQLKKGVRVLLLVIGSLVAIAIALLPVVGINKDKLIPYIDDPFAVGNFEAAVNWSYAESVWGLLYLAGIWVAVMLMRKDFRKGMITLCVVQLVIIQVTVLHFTPKIEAFSQRAAIDYFKSFRGKDVYVHVLGYKSYAHLFYTSKHPPTNKNSYNEDWLLNGPVDKPTYFICKITEAHKFQEQPQLEQIGAKNGFVFFRRR
ncbi:MAG: glycosyltransferase family 39 protein [Sphingobacteriales bacterium]|nr:MAG: glycosyltransferase family 39 protein [Sphingobacteriales bacterium]